MNEWVRRLRSSVQSVVDGKRRKSAASPQTDGSRRKTTHDEPAPPAATELDLPPAETPQLSSLTKQRARGPPRRRPSPGQRTVSCPPTDDDPARFAWGRDPTIDPALFFSDVVGRCLSAHPAAGTGSEGSARLGSIAESESQRSSRLSEGGKRSSRVSESGRRSSSGSGSGEGEGQGDEKGEGESGKGEGEGERTDGDGESADSEVAQDEGKEAGGGKADSEKSEAGVEKAEARKEAERPVSAGRKSPVLHLTGGQVEGAPKKRFCTLL